MPRLLEYLPTALNNDGERRRGFLVSKVNIKIFDSFGNYLGAVGKYLKKVNIAL
jgi:hypothetical protein